jgi:hypothetical protein
MVGATDGAAVRPSEQATPISEKINPIRVSKRMRLESFTGQESMFFSLWAAKVG